MTSEDETSQSLNALFARLGKKVSATVAHWRASRICPSTLKADSDEVVGLALYIEVAEQLANAEFLTEDDKCTLTVQLGDDGEKAIGANFGKEDVLKGALGPFRRIWLNDELSNFGRVVGIMIKYGTDEERVAFAAQQNFLFRHNLDHKVFSDDTITARKLVDLWLNTQFAHGGTLEERAQIDTLVQKVTAYRFEYEFRHAVKSAGGHFLNLLHGCVLPEFTEWKKQFGIQPPFQFTNAFGFVGHSGATPGIVRKSAGTLVPHETIEQRFSRLIERDRFGALKTELESLFDLRCHSADERYRRVREACDALRAYANYLDLLTNQKVKISFKKPRGKRELSHHEFADIKTWRRGRTQWQGRQAVWMTEDAVPILQEQYGDFRALLTAAA